MKLRSGNTGTALEAMRVKLAPSIEPSSTKLAGSRSGTSSALIRVRERTGRLPDGVMVRPVLILSKLRYLLVTSLSMALGARLNQGEFVEVPTAGSPGTEASRIGEIVSTEMTRSSMA